MKKLKLFKIFILLASIFAFSYSAESRVEKIEDKNIKNNIAYFKNESVPFTGRFTGKNISEEYKDGIRNGFFKGTVTVNDVPLIYEGRYTEGIKHGQWVLKYPDGSTNAVVKYNYDRPHGQWTFFYKNNKIKSTENFSEGILEGKFTEYDENGNLLKRVVYKNGLIDGEVVFFHSPNVLETVADFSLGKLDGEIKLFSFNGNIILEGQYSNNKREGIWKFYYKTGEIKIIVPYKNGLKHGEINIFGKGGEIIQKSFFKNGSELDEKGNVVSQSKNFKDGIVERFKEFNRNLEYEKYDKSLSNL